MTHHAPLPATPKEAIAAALDAYWITTPPGEDIYWTIAADQVDDYLTACGFTITTAPQAAMAAAAAYATANRCTCPTPTRTAITLTALLALACLTACLACLIRGEQGWAFAALGAAASLTGGTAANYRMRRARR